MRRLNILVAVIVLVIGAGVSVFAGTVMKDGFYDEVDVNGVRLRTVEYQLGVAHGRFRAYYPDGRLQASGTYLNGKLDGLLMAYYPDGKPETKMFYRDGVLHGLKTAYYSDGRMMREEPFIAGWKDGLVREYSTKGVLAFERQFRHNQQDGITREYFSSGGVYREYDYRNGVQHGRIREYLVDGRLKGVYRASDGRRSGVGREYFPTGELLNEGFYENDFLNGQVRIYYRSGRPRVRANYTNGKINDPAWREFYESGAIHWVIPVRMDSREGVGREYAEDGQLKAEGFFKDNERSGVFNVYDSHGTLAVKETYAGGWLARRVEFFPSGKVRSDQHFFREEEKYLRGNRI